MASSVEPADPPPGPLPRGEGDGDAGRAVLFLNLVVGKWTPRGCCPADKNSTHLAPRDVPHAEREEYFGERGEDVAVRSDLSATFSDLRGSNLGFVAVSAYPLTLTPALSQAEREVWEG